MNAASVLLGRCRSLTPADGTAELGNAAGVQPACQHFLEKTPSCYLHRYISDCHVPDGAQLPLATIACNGSKCMAIILGWGQLQAAMMPERQKPGAHHQWLHAN